MSTFEDGIILVLLGLLMLWGLRVAFGKGRMPDIRRRLIPYRWRYEEFWRWNSPVTFWTIAVLWGTAAVSVCGLGILLLFGAFEHPGSAASSPSERTSAHRPLE